MKIGSMVHTTKHQLIVEIVTQSAIHRIQTWQKRISIGSKHSKGNGKEWLEVFENQENFFRKSASNEDQVQCFMWKGENENEITEEDVDN